MRPQARPIEFQSFGTKEVVNYSAIANKAKQLSDNIRTVAFDQVNDSITFKSSLIHDKPPVSIKPSDNSINNVSSINCTDGSTITGITSDSTNTDPTKAISANILTDLNTRFTALESKTQNQTATENETTFTGNITADTFNGFHLGMNNSFYKLPAIPIIRDDLVMEVGRYIDFHYNNSTSIDYKSRLSISSLGTLHFSHSFICDGGDIKARNCIANGGNLNDISSRTKSLETKNTEQDERLNNLESKDIAHEERMTNIESKNTEQDTRLDALESKDIAIEERIGSIEAMDTAQNETLSNINTKNDEQDTRLTNIESKNTEQDTRLTNIETKNTEQDTRLDTIETMDTAQNETLSIINTKNNEQDTRLDALEIVNTEQDGRIDTLDRKDLEQGIRLDSLESKNTEQDTRLTNIETKNTEQDTRIQSLESNQITLTMINNEHITYNISGTASFADNIFTFVFDEQPTTGTIYFLGDFFDGNDVHPADFTIYFSNGAYSNMEILYLGEIWTNTFQGEYNSSTLTFKLFGNNGSKTLNSFYEATLSINMPNEKVITHTQDTKSLNILSEDLTDNNVYSASKLLDIIYPIGSIYLTFNQSPPAIGTWELLTDGYFLQSTTTTSGETGGSESHTHTTANHTLTVGEMPKHNHTFKGNKITGTVYDIMKYDSGGQTNKNPEGAFSVNRYGNRTWNGIDGSNRAFSLTFTATPTGSISYEGSNQAHNHGNTGSSSNLPPYITCFMYKRTA